MKALIPIDVTYDGNAVTVTYDDDLSESASVAFDRSGAPAGAAVHLTITDPRLNLNPTDEDTWTLTVNPDVEDDNNPIYPAYFPSSPMLKILTDHS